MADIKEILIGSTVYDIKDDNARSRLTTLESNALQSSDVVNDVVSTDTDKPLSANMGKELQDEINNLKARGRFLTLWNCATGLASTNPPSSPYTYKAGDYFIVGTIASGSASNYKPNGSSYTTGTASTTVETASVSVDDVYYYDGTTWKLQINTQKTVSFSSIAGQPSDNTNLATALNGKVDTNTAITGDTKCKITYDSKGLVTSGADLQASDIPNLTLSKITDITATATELNYVDGVTSSIQTQLNGKQDTLVSGTNIKTINNNSILGTGNITINTELLPSQSGQSGKFLTTDGSNASWANVDALPSQTGQSGKYLTTNGTSASWGTITVPSKISDLTDDTSTNPIDKADTLTNLTATVAELNVLDGITATTTELNYTDGVTSNIQTQLNAKAADNAVVKLTGAQTVAGSKTFTNTAVFSNDNFGEQLSVVRTNNASGAMTIKYVNGSTTKGFIGLDSSGRPSYFNASAVEQHLIRQGTANTAVGSATQPIYTDADGIATACTYSLSKSVPSNAEFTDTKVTQTVTSTNSSYPVLLAPANQTTTQTTTTNFGSGMTINPAVGSLIMQGSNTSANIEGAEIDMKPTAGSTAYGGISLDVYNSTFRVFGIPSADGTTKTGTGTVLVIDPWAKTITGGYTFTGNITGSSGSCTGNSATATTLTGLTASVAELNYVDGVTSSIQTQLNAKANDSDVVKLTGDQTISGTKTFNNTITGTITKAIQDSVGDQINNYYAKRRDVITGAVDWNNYTDYGCYKVQNATMTADYNAPVAEYQYGLLVVEKSAVASENRILQIYYPHQPVNNGVTWLRMLNGSAWSIWRKLTGAQISKGSTTQPVYFDANGNAQPITSYSGNSATATKATQDSDGNVITSTYQIKATYDIDNEELVL